MHCAVNKASAVHVGSSNPCVLNLYQELIYLFSYDQYAQMSSY